MKLGKKSANGLAVGTVGGVVAAAIGLLGAGAGVAQPTSVTIDYQCPLPLIGTKTITTKISTDIPPQVEVGEQTPKLKLDIASTVPAKAVQALNLVGAATLEGTVAAQATVKAPKFDVPIQMQIDIPKTPIPDSGSFVLHLSATAPALVFQEPGTATIKVGPISMTMTPRKADGSKTGLGTFTSDCTIPPDENTTLGSFEIVPATTTTEPPTETSTSNPTTTTPPTETSTSNPTTTTPPTETSTSTPTTTTSTDPGGGPGGPLAITYKVDGSSYVKKLDATLPLNGTFDALVNLSKGTFEGDLEVEPAQVEFTLFHFLPASSTVAVDDVGGTTGVIEAGAVTATSIVSISLTDVSVLGIPLVSNSSTCQTVKTTSVHLTSGPNFDPLSGGTLSGTYAIPKFENCGIATSIINMVTPGPGNTIEIKLSRSQN